MKRTVYLLQQFELQKLKPSEMDELLNIITVDEHTVIEALMERIDSETSIEAANQQEWALLLNRIIAVDKPVVKKLNKVLWFRVSAAAILLIIASIGLFFRNGIAPKKEQNQLVNNIKPGSNKAILTLADGSKVSLTDAKTGRIANEHGVKIVKAKDGQLIYTIAQNLKSITQTFNTITTPRGGQYQLIMPDGTKVWLNTESSIKFSPDILNTPTRYVELNGEAYFEVAKSQRPFIIKTNKQIVKVLGTHFNINSYYNEPTVKTTLLEGSVLVETLQKVQQNRKINKVHLVSGQESILQNNTLIIVSANSEDALDWKNGNFVFANEKIESIMRKISRWYDVEVVYQGEVPEATFVGSISRFKQITEVLNILELTQGVHFKIKGRRVIVMS